MILKIKQLNNHGYYDKQVEKPAGDSGIDLFFPNRVRVPKRESLLVDFEIRTFSAQKEGGIHHLLNYD